LDLRVAGENDRQLGLVHLNSLEHCARTSYDIGSRHAGVVMQMNTVGRAYAVSPGV
jgi:hypothetical protein